MSIDGIRAVDKEPLAASDYLFGMSTADGQRIGPRPISTMAVAQQITSLLPNGSVKSYASVAAMNADTAPAIGTLAYADGKTYRKTGAAGTAGWSVFLNFIPGTQILPAILGGSTTANAIRATTPLPIPLDGAALIILPIEMTNTSSPVTVSFNDDPFLTIKSISDADIPIDGFDQVRLVAGFIDGAIFRLITDYNSAVHQQAAKAWAENAENDPIEPAFGGDGSSTYSSKHWAKKSNAGADRSEAARDIAAGYASDAVSQGNVPIYATVEGMPAIEVPAGINALRVNGYSAPGDGGAALYKKVGAEPAHAGKFQSADGAWWELAEEDISQGMVNSTLASLLTAAGSKASILDDGELSLPATLNVSGSSNINLRGRNRANSIIKRAAGVASAMSFNAAHDMTLRDFNLNMDFTNTGQSGHGIILVDTNDGEVRNVTVSDLGNMGGSGGSGIMGYKSGTSSPIRHKIIDCKVTGNLALSDNTNGILLSNTRFSQMRGNFASGIAAFAHEYKNDARYNTGSDLISANSAYGLGFGQTTVDTDGVDYTAITNVVAAACDMGFTLGEGSYNAINNLIINTDSSPGLLSGKFGLRLSAGARGNLITDVVSVGAGTTNSVRIGDGVRNHISIAAHDGSAKAVVFTDTSRGNFVEVLHSGLRTSIEDAITDTTGNSIDSANANVVYSPTTGERLGSQSGFFKDSLHLEKLNYSSIQKWRYQSPDYVYWTAGLPAAGALGFGIQGNVGDTANVAGFTYSVASSRWGLRAGSTAIGRFDTGVWSPVLDNLIALGSGVARFTTVYATSGTINTSDEREKEDVTDARDDEAAIRAVRKIKIRRFRWKDAVAQKGDGARLHFGAVAQEVKAAFESEGLDAFAYGLLCYDEWEATGAVLDDDGNETLPAVEAGNRYGVRYDELLALKIAAIDALPD